jgi:hypothetical protein
MCAHPINADWNFPLIRNLPLMVKTDSWSWETFGQKRDFWIGTDPQLNSWVVKLCGKLGAVHEHVYAAFAQSLGICTQSSVFLILDESSLPLQGQWHPDKIPYNVGLWKFDEHGHDPCGPSCPYNNTKAAINEWPEWGLKNPWDKIEARFLGYLCGMSEPTQDLITTDHLWVQIDNELIFGCWAFKRGKAHDSVLREVVRDGWLKIDGARNRLKILCERISDVSDLEIERIVAIPSEYRSLTRAARLKRYLRQTRRTATKIGRVFS